MNFVESVRTCLRKYAVFRGCATRPEYWWFVLFNLVGSLVLSFTRLVALSDLWILAFLCPQIAAAIRRHHDAGRSGWWLLTNIIPPWGIILLCYPTKTVGNNYRDPSETVPSSSAITEASVTTSTTYCPTCGKLRLPGQEFCSACGTRLTSG